MAATEIITLKEVSRILQRFVILPESIGIFLWILFIVVTNSIHFKIYLA